MGFGENTSAELERIATAIVDAAFKVHKTFGPGLLESVYVLCLMHELRKRGFKVSHQVWLPVFYDGERIEKAYRIDLLVNDLIAIEAKAVEKLHEIHRAQLMTHLRLSSLTLGFLINFNVTRIKDGIKRVIYTGGQFSENETE